MAARVLHGVQCMLVAAMVLFISALLLARAAWSHAPETVGNAPVACTPVSSAAAAAPSSGGSTSGPLAATASPDHVSATTAVYKMGSPSAFRCTEGKFGERSCEVHNVCVRVEANVTAMVIANETQVDLLELQSRFLYFYDGNASKPPSPLAGAAGRANDPRNPFALKLVPATARPSDAGVMRVRKPTLLALRHSAGNPGHLLVDLMFPLFMLDRAIRGPGACYDAASVRVMVDDLCDTGSAWNRFTLFENPPQLCEKFTAKYLELMSTEPLLYAFDLVGHRSVPAAGIHHVCFDRLLVGASQYGAFSSIRGFIGRGEELRQFRDWMWRVHAVDPTVRSATDPPVILIHRKLGRRTLNNTDEIAAQLRLRVGDTAKVTVLDIGSLSLTELFQLLANTAVYITPPGSAAMLAVLMAEQSTMLTANFYSTSVPQGWQHEFWTVFDRLLHVKSFLMPSVPHRVGQGMDDYYAHVSDHDAVFAQIAPALHRWRQPVPDQLRDKCVGTL